jgi:hypothetical protein
LLELLTDHFNGDQAEALRFLRAFTPIALHIPPMMVIERLDRDARVARSLVKDPSEANVRRQSQFHSVPMRNVVKMVSKAVGMGVMELRARKESGRRMPKLRCRGPRTVRDVPGQMELFLGP